MSEKIYQSKEFIEACKDATIKALAGKVKDEDVKQFLNRIPAETAVPAVGVPAPAEAKGETDRALELYKKSLQTSKKIENKRGLTVSPKM